MMYLARYVLHKIALRPCKNFSP